LIKEKVTVTGEVVAVPEVKLAISQGGTPEIENKEALKNQGRHATKRGHAVDGLRGP